jgi:hypothetical protein
MTTWNREGNLMKWGKFRFGSVKIDGDKYKNDIVLDQGAIRKRKKKLSRPFRAQFGHTPVSLKEDIPWGPDAQRKPARHQRYLARDLLATQQRAGDSQGEPMSPVGVPDTCRLFRRRRPTREPNAARGSIS